MFEETQVVIAIMHPKIMLASFDTNRITKEEKGGGGGQCFMIT